MAIIRWNNPASPASPRTGFGRRSWDDFNLLQNEMNRLFNSFFPAEGAASFRGRVYPPVNLYEDEEKLCLTAELPGMEAQDIEINVEGDTLQLKGERRIAPEKEGITYHRREREPGRFGKTIALPAQIETDKVSAHMENGVLVVELPKAEAAKPKKIEVKIK